MALGKEWPSTGPNSERALSQTPATTRTATTDKTTRLSSSTHTSSSHSTSFVTQTGCSYNILIVTPSRSLFMALVDLRVEFAAASHSFHVQVPQDASILDVKREIKTKCPGNPREDGQRVIWRGRPLGDDERVADIWKSPDDARIVHLAVRPSAWTTEPPMPPNAPSATSQFPYRPQPHSQTNINYAHSTQPSSIPLSLVVAKHKAAIHVLTHGHLPPVTASELAQQASLRHYTISVIQSYGWSWPSILDEDYPPAVDSPDTLKYERVTLEHHPYLKLTNPNASPSPCQAHAIRVLTHTFALLAIPMTPDPTSFPRLSPPGLPFTTPATYHHFQQFGFPPARVAPNQNPNQNPNDRNRLRIEIRIPLRALIVPLVMLAFRTVLLMYFFSPSKRPVFGVLLSAWILYEAWGAFRAVLGNGVVNQPGGAAGVPGNNQNGNINPGVGPAGQNGRIPPGGQNTNSTQRRSQVGVVLDNVAEMNLGAEDAILAMNDRRGDSAPSLGHRVKTFVGLLVTTLHPAVWDRRRNALRRREARVRTEANARDAASPPQNAEGSDGPTADAEPRAHPNAHLVELHEGRPQWVKDYVERVQMSEWADDA